ncbi:hypothetical protein [Kribbella sp. NPDC049584]|uniref:hypothetical protein n=1 Tax=Kribbella sp. NPDC049584 TaxID=3154833 RepID=UPI00342704C9
MTMSLGDADERYLRSLEVEVDADIELNAANTPDEDDLGSPADWLLDPVEAQEEAVELHSLHDAIAVLEGDEEPGAGSTLSSS